MQKTAWGVALALAIFAAAWIYRGGSEIDEEKRSMRASSVAHDARGQSADAMLQIQAGLPMRRAEPGDRKLSALMQEYFSSRGLGDLFERLKGAPQRTAEENWVLAEILEKCAQVTDRKPPKGVVMTAPTVPGPEAKARFVASISEKDPNRDKRIAAYDRMRVDRCGGIRKLATTTVELDALRKAAADAGDPKAKMWAARSLPGLARYELAREVMRSGDALAMEAAGFYLASGSEDFSLRAGPQELPIDTQAFGNAARLLACDFGKPCGPESDGMAWSCALRGQCEARNLREHVFFYESSPAQSQLIAEYELALTRAARDGDWSYFTVHPGPGPFAAIFMPPPKPAPVR